MCVCVPEVVREAVSSCQWKVLKRISPLGQKDFCTSRAALSLVPSCSVSGFLGFQYVACPAEGCDNFWVLTEEQPPLPFMTHLCCVYSVCSASQVNTAEEIPLSCSQEIISDQQMSTLPDLKPHPRNWPRLLFARIGKMDGQVVHPEYSL